MPLDWLLTLGVIAGILMMVGGLATLGRRGHTPVAAARRLSVPTRLVFGLILMLAGFQVAVHCVPAGWGLRVSHMRFPTDRLGWVGAAALVAVLVSLAMDRLHAGHHGDEDAER